MLKIIDRIVFIFNISDSWSKIECFCLRTDLFVNKCPYFVPQLFRKLVISWFIKKIVLKIEK